MAGRTPRLQSEWFAELAHDAWERGHAALSAGDIAVARRWLERAERIAPDDSVVGLSLATALLRDGDPRAADVYARVARATDAREAWFGLAAAEVARGDASAAAAAVARVLSRKVLSGAAGVDPLLSSVAAAAGLPGWCCLADDASLRLHPFSPIHVAARVTVDGRPVVASGLRISPPHRAVVVAIGGRALLGSPIDVVGVFALEGFARVRDGGIEGWAWHPGMPDRAPDLTVLDRRGRVVARVTARDEVATPVRPFARARAWRLDTASLPAGSGPLRVVGPDGRDVTGSPLDPGAEAAAARVVARAVAARTSGRPPRHVPAMPAIAAVPADIRGAPAAAPSRPRRHVAVIVPVYRDRETTVGCLDRVAATVPLGTKIIVVDDATPDPGLADDLDARARAKRITLVRHQTNRGFPAAANSGIAATAGRDVVLLNSDALVTVGWLERLRAAVHADGTVGSATPLSNDATILSYPDVTSVNPLPDARKLTRMGRLAARANPALTIEIPTAVGFCMYIRRECLDEVGLFRDDVFAQGYGEENDWSLRARHLGWRHVAVPGAYVGHVGGQSFGTARTHLIARNLDVLERLHPGYRAMIAAFGEADPLAAARRNLDIARFAAARSRRGAVALVTHDSGGGVARIVGDRAAALRRDGFRPIVLRSVRDRTGLTDQASRQYRGDAIGVSDDTDEPYPNLVFRLPDELRSITALLRREGIVAIEIHHLLGHAAAAVLELPARLAVPYDVWIHDFAWFCPRITLVTGAGRYCGEPVEIAACEACIDDFGRNIEEEIGVAALRSRSAALLAAARRVVAPSADAASRIRRQFPAITPDVLAHDNDATLPPPDRNRSARDGDLLVCIPGAIGIEKGFDVLLACARDAAARQLALRFVVVGHTRDDERLFATGRVFVTGPYRDAEVVGLIRRQRANLAFLPSIWPETWCLTLGHAWRAGLDVAAFDIGAPAQRIRATGRGFLLPLGLPPAAINNALLAARPVAGDECPA